MPRISYPENADFRLGLDDDPCNLNIDLCNACWPLRRKQIPEEIDPVWIDQGDDSLGAEHPEYTDTDYCCDNCGRRLMSRDD